jgi:hypothetical protein
VREDGGGLGSFLEDVFFFFFFCSSLVLVAVRVVSAVVGSNKAPKLSVFTSSSLMRLALGVNGSN